MIAGQLDLSALPQEKWVKVYESGRFSSKEPNPDFGTLNFDSQFFYGGDLGASIKFELFNFKDDGDHKAKGEITVKLCDILEGKEIAL